MTTQAEMVVIVRARLDEAVGEHQWLNSELRGWINEAVRDVARRTESLQVTEDIAAVIGQHNYTAPADIVRATALEWRPTAGGVYRMEFAPIHVFKAHVSSQQEDTQGRPVLWTTWGYAGSLEFLVYPTPGEAGSFRSWYYKVPTDLNTDGSAATTDLVIPSGWEDLIADYAEFRAKRKDGDPDWQAAKELYDEHLSDLVETAQQWADQAGSIVTPSGPIPGWLAGDGVWGGW